MPSKDVAKAAAGLDALLRSLGEGIGHFHAWRRSSLGLRGMLLYVLSVPLALAGVVALAGGHLLQAFAAGSAFALVAGGGFLNRRGIVEALLAPERRYTQAWELPHKYLAALAVTLGTGLAAYGAAGHRPSVSVAFALLSLLGFHLAYRLPGPKAVFPQGPQLPADDALRKLLAQAEQRILSIEKASLRLGNRELEQRLQRIAARGREILDQIAARPEERFRARKFLNVYLEGAERVASRYTRSHPLARGGELERNFRSVLVEIETAFEQQLKRQTAQEAFDLDVQIEVLRKQLVREGIV